MTELKMKGYWELNTPEDALFIVASVRTATEQ